MELVTDLYMTVANGINDLVKKGVEAAFEELTKDDSLVDVVKEHVKKSVVESINSSCNSYELKRILTNKINDAAMAKIDKIADKYADQIALGLSAAMAELRHA